MSTASKKQASLASFFGKKSATDAAPALAASTAEPGVAAPAPAPAAAVLASPKSVNTAAVASPSKRKSPPKSTAPVAAPATAVAPPAAAAESDDEVIIPKAGRKRRAAAAVVVDSESEQGSDYVDDKPSAPGASAAATSSSSAAAAPVAGRATKKARDAAGGGGSGGGATEGAEAAIAACIGYHPINDAEWTRAPTLREKGVPFSALTAVFAAVEGTSKRVGMTSLLTNFFRSVLVASPDDLLPCVYLCTNTIAPAYEAKELGVGDSILIKALAEATGRQVKDVKSAADDAGDLGIVAETSRSKQRTIFGFGSAAAGASGAPASSLTVRSVFAAFKSIANESGKSSQDKKIAGIKRLLVGANGVDAKYIIRAMQGSLRIGLAKQTVHVALAHACTFTHPLALEGVLPDAEPKLTTSSEGALDNVDCARAAGYEVTPRGETDTPVVLDTCTAASGKRVPKDVCARRLEASVALLKQLLSEMPSYDVLIPALRAGGVSAARAVCNLTPGIPVSPMLAKPTKGVKEVLDRFEAVEGGFTCEWKYDGERAQVHVLEGGSPGVRVAVYSRNSENTSSKYPDLADAVKAAAGEVTSCVLDGEVIAYDREKGTLLPFQVLSTRARKDVAVEDIKVQVIYVAFDLLYLNGVSLLMEPLVRRRELLKSHFKEVSGRFAFAMHVESSAVEEISGFLNDAVKGGCEGLMVKVLDGPDSVYLPSRRSLNWLKLKKDYMDGLTDTCDLVPIAAWKGKGKRTGVYGAYLLACYDPDDDVYASITRIGTGFSEDLLEELTRNFKEKGCERAARPRNVLVGEATASDVDVWFDPDESEVWEVLAADLSISPEHMAALGRVDDSKGIALRFPRFKTRRMDKAPSDATTAAQIVDMYRAQASASGKARAHADDDDD